MNAKLISVNEFNKIELTCGTIISAEINQHVNHQAYLLRIDFGSKGIKKSSAQITHYPLEKLIGKQIVAVTNLPPKQIGKVMSECLVLAAVNNDFTTLLIPDSKMENGVQVK